jgi:carboxyl-terminal processing protease
MAGKSTTDVGAFLRGAPNTAVTLIIDRNGQPLEKKITRVSVRTKNVPWSGMINDQTGYIKLDEFGQNCAQEIESALLNLQKNPAMNKLVLDLRGNGGGLLGEAVDIVGLFVGENKLVVNMKGRSGESNRKWMTRKPAVAADLPLVVLVDAQSASASEVVSGSLQDMDRAVIIGQNSFGKGLVQNFFPLPYRTQMKITTAKYYTPSGRCIQLLDYSKRNPDGSAGSIPDSLRKAFKTATGRTVYDGGGIRPDVVVDPFSGEPLIKYLLEERFVFDFANDFRNNNATLPNDARFITPAQFETFGKQCAAKLKGQLRKKMEDALQNSVKDEELVKMIMNGVSDAKLEKAVLDHINHCGETLMYRMESEIIARYPDAEREYKHMFMGDPDLAAALKTLNNPDAYNRILRK